MDANETKLKSIYQILLGFSIVDGEYRREEEDIVLEFLLENYRQLDPECLSLQENLKEMSESDSAFEENAANVKFLCSRDEMLRILVFISGLIYSDGEYQTEEEELFTKLIAFWGFTKEDL